MFNLGPMEVLVIVVIALVVLGPQRLPDAMRQVGKGMGEMRRWTTQLNTEVQSAFVGRPDAAPARPASSELPMSAPDGGMGPVDAPAPVTVAERSS